jgi:tetratricopeptide (TPR) repeat protein
MNLAATLPIADGSPLDGELARLRRMQADGAHDEALTEARRLLCEAPESRDLLLVEASALRHLGKIDEALASLDRLAALQPRYSLMYQERGLCHVARKDAPAAIASLLAAVNINPALPFAWRMLEGVYRLTGDVDNAATAAEHSATLAALPREVVTATSLYQDGDLEPAEALIRRFLLAHGDHPEAMRLLAKIGIAHQVYGDAEILLAGVLAMVPEHRAARLEYAQALTHRQKFVEAQEALAPLLADDPASHEYRALASTIAVGLGRQDEAIDLYRAMLAEIAAAPQDTDPLAVDGRAHAQADLNLWLGHALKTVGELPEAIDAYRASAAARSDFGDAYWSLANLKSYHFTDLEIAAMQAAAIAADTAEVDRVHLCFALGKGFEDRAAFAESWFWYERGNALQRAASRYRPEIFETNARLQRETCTAAFFEARSGWGVDDPDPIFILGLPRAGSTLIEQILASHSDVEGTQELPNVQRMVHELQGRDPDLDAPRYPSVLAEMNAGDFAELGRRYLEETRVYRSGKRFFIDKMPNNFRHVGLIHLMLPNARVIDARRDPMACCFSNLKQLFATGQEFTYSIEDIARYYRTYLDLMEHWDAALPGRVLRVQHEDVIDDLEGSVRRILDHCGLPFEAACLDFHQTRRSVRTPSSEQVRQPIFREGLTQWSHYRPWLGTLQESLGDALIRYR